MRALHLTPDGEVSTFDLDLGNDYGLAVLQERVGGWVELVTTSEFGGVSVWLNEEGKVNGLAANHNAQKVLRRAGLSLFDTVVGPAVVTGIDYDGEITDLTDAQLEALYQRTG
jgi:hypothetical protein